MGDLIDGANIEMRVALAPTRTVPVTGIQSLIGLSTGVDIASKIVTSAPEFGSGAASRGEEANNTGYAWSMPFQGNIRYTGAGAAALDIIRAAAASGSEVYVWIYPQGIGAGRPKRAGFTLIENYSEPLPRDGVLTVTFSLKGLVLLDTANQV